MTLIDRLNVWRSMRAPVSTWRRQAREAMVLAVEELFDSGEAIGEAVVLRVIDQAYPFGPRKYHPYKAWLSERKLLREVLGPHRRWEVPTAEDIAACDVARDLVELERHDDAAKLLREQAPRRLMRTCPACGAKPGRNCQTMTEYYDELLVPHAARLVVQASTGPLFAPCVPDPPKDEQT